MSTPERPEPADLPYGAAEARSGQLAGDAAHYAADGYTPPADPTEQNRLGTWSLVAAAVALIATILPVIIYLPLGLVSCAAALWFGVQSVRAVRRGRATNSGMAVTGLVIGGFATLLYLLSVVGLVFLPADIA
jgi:hypothetical protein